MIINHEHPKYIEKWNKIGAGKFNGAYYYSKEICENIIPNVKTDRNWITVNIIGEAIDHSIVFIHNNIHTDHYDWLKNYNDLILVCGVPQTVPKVRHIAKTIYLPLSVDVMDVAKHYRPIKDREVAFIGRAAKTRNMDIPCIADCVTGLEREEFLEEVSHYKKVYGVGRAAIEAKILGCDILPYDPRYMDTSLWEIVDNKDAARMLQSRLMTIDNAIKEDTNEHQI